jgi:hypothetical protein
VSDVKRWGCYGTSVVSAGRCLRAGLRFTEPSKALSVRKESDADVADTDRRRRQPESIVPIVAETN